jgi:DNA-binding NarL/FixJ family response regulator
VPVPGAEARSPWRAPMGFRAGPTARMTSRLETEVAGETLDIRTAGSRPRGGPPRILVLDPAPERRTGLRLLLEQANMTVFTAASGTEALHAAGLVDPDVAVIDLRVPDWDGLALVRQLQRRIPGVQVLVQTSAARRAVIAEARRAGALDTIDGGTAPAEVVETVREAVGIGRTAAEVAASWREATTSRSANGRTGQEGGASP